MTNDNEQTQEVTAIEIPAISDDMSFSDYQKVRRGLPIEKAESAPQEKKPEEQKKSSKSDAEETEAKESESEEELDDESDESNDSEKDKPKKKGGFQRRIDKLNTRYSEERQRREALEARLAQLESAAGKPKEEIVDAANVNADDEPQSNDFETHAEYVKAVAKWTLKQEQKAEKAEQEHLKHLAEQKQLMESHQKRVKAFADKTHDFMEVLQNLDDVRSVALEQIILESDNGPEILYELAKNPEEAKRIAALSPLAVAREIGRIESKLLSKAAEPKPEPKKLTNAPKPIAPVGKSGSGSISKSIDDPDLSYKEYERLRREQMKRKRG